MDEHEGKDTGAGGGDKQMELQLGGRHLTLAVVGLAVFGVVLFLLGRWSERVARPASQPTEGVEETALPGSGSAPDPAQPKELTFYETLGKKATPGFQESSPSSGRREAPAVLPDSPAPPPAAGSRGASPPAPKAKESVAKPPASGGKDRFRVQVASTRDGAAARQLVERLRKKGYAASLETSQGSDGKAQYKVRIGSYSERGPAEAEAARIRSEEKVGAWIVRVQG